MATLADSFLADLEDLEAPSVPVIPHLQGYAKDEAKDEPDDGTISKMLKDEEFTKTMEKIREKKEDAAELLIKKNFSEEDEEYKLVVRANGMIGEIDEEMFKIYDVVKEIYAVRFPQMDQIIGDPFSFFLTVHRIGRSVEIAEVDFSDVLRSNVIMSLQITASTAKTAPLPDDQMDKALTGCEEAFTLADCKADVLRYLESRMSIFAPNLTTLVTPVLAAKLVTAAGGLPNLARMPAQNIPLLGVKKNQYNQHGFAGMGKRGWLHDSDLVMGQKPEFQSRALRTLQGGVSIAARCDVNKSFVFGEQGSKLREEIQGKMVKIAAPPPAKQKKALPVPDDVPCRKRGGKRNRKDKEKYY